MPLLRIVVGAALSALLAAGPARAAEPLPSFQVDLGQTTVSGLSSGAYMALQFHVAFSGTVRGAGIVAGGPFYCAQGQLALALNQCMQTFMGTPDPARLLALARGYAQQGRLDPLDNLEDDRVYLFTGLTDNTVTAPVVDAARRFYLLAGLPAGGLQYRNDLPAGHAMLTEDYGDPCPSTDPPFINDCDYDQAGAILKQLYPDLKPAAAQPGGNILAFDQREFFGAGGSPVPGPGPVSGSLPGMPTPPAVPFGMPIMPMMPPGMPMMPSGWAGMPGQPGGAGFSWGWPWGPWWPQMPGMGSTLSLNDTGYAYVPTACADGETCKVHVVFHGCKQTVEDIQEQYVRRTGYNRWADGNGIIVLYPQARHDPQGNPNGCWDWWGYSGTDYATKVGPQMAAVRAMLDRLAGN
jgi:poly(3-hydroxybutyrate) depolymerase